VLHKKGVNDIQRGKVSCKKGLEPQKHPELNEQTHLIGQAEGKFIKESVNVPHYFFYR